MRPLARIAALVLFALMWTCQSTEAPQRLSGDEETLPVVTSFLGEQGGDAARSVAVSHLRRQERMPVGGVLHDRSFITEHKTPEAVINDVQTLYRICSSRPQRTVTPFGKMPCRLLARFFLSHKLSTLNAISLNGNVRLETAPFPSSAPCDYYVFALRHLLC